MTMWGGRFQGGPDELFRAFNDSLPVDHRLFAQDIEGSIAWANAIARAGVLTQDECARVVIALREIGQEIGDDTSAIIDSGQEDVHSYVESRLIELLGTLGKKLHTGRSRNDQVATDLRLWIKAEVGKRGEELRALQSALIECGERQVDAVVPGMTHLQPAQPVLFAHWCLSFFEMFDRDARRLKEAVSAADQCPLGAGALAGTAYDVDRQAIARDLGFAAPCANSLDAVSDRDFVLDALHAAAVCGIHLSRFAEDLIIGAGTGYIAMDDGVTSGSSLMPQKKNPDALELIRAFSAKLVSRWMEMAVLLKGLPLAYNKDLQEDKTILFSAMETLSLCLRMAMRVVEGLEVRKEQALAAAMAGHTNATDLADYLVRKGVPFREAHDLTGQIVLLAVKKNVAIEKLGLEELQQFSPNIKQDVYDVLSVESVLNRRSSLGGTSPKRVGEALDEARRRLAQG